jgi:MinD superfamily P-loop ATPase
MHLTIAVSSGKGGTGKTFVATNIAVMLQRMGYSVNYLDCDVEEPNGHLFLKPVIVRDEPVTLFSPMEVDEEKCTACGQCVEACQYNALALIKGRILLFQNMCHICGACTLICPVNAIVEKARIIGQLVHGRTGSMDVYYGLLKTAEGGMSPRLIKQVKEKAAQGINILDSAPGTSCPVVQTVKDADLCVLVTDPTPFGVHDLRLSVEMCRELGQEPVVIVNRAVYMNNDLKAYCKQADLEIVGEIPDDRKIAECYSVGDLVVDQLPSYRHLFHTLINTLILRAQSPKTLPKKASAIDPPEIVEQVPEPLKNPPNPHKINELVIISGKGGTGKTSLTACFCAIEKMVAIADCDVDAADLHLILRPQIREKGVFIGGLHAAIDPEKCTGCGICIQHCRFDAIYGKNMSGKNVFFVDEFSCEGCGVCEMVCPKSAVQCNPAINGEWYLSDTRFGPMSHARLGVAEENSGKLVTLVRKNTEALAEQFCLDTALIDGSPGTGCPVIASITGARYALVVTEPTVSGIHDLKRVLDLLRFFKVPSGVIVNKSDLNQDNTQKIKVLVEQNSSDFLGAIPYDKRITEAQFEGKAVIEYTDDEISQTIRQVWQKVQEAIKNSVR